MPVVTRSQAAAQPPVQPPAVPPIRIISTVRRGEILQQQAGRLRQILSLVQQEMNEEPPPSAAQRQQLLLLQDTATAQLEEIERELDSSEHRQQRRSWERRRALRLIRESTLPFNANRTRVLLFQAGSLQAYNNRLIAVKHEE